VAVGRKVRGSLALIAGAGVVGGVVWAVRALRSRRSVSRAVVVGAPLEEVFARVSRLEGLPEFFGGMTEVQRLAGDRYRFSAPGSRTWEGQVTRYVPNEVIAWASDPESSIESAGAIRVRRRSRGTRVEARLSGNALGRRAGQQLARDLRRLRALCERS
jgi:uncharacterized membrane protein